MYKIDLSRLDYYRINTNINIYHKKNHEKKILKPHDFLWASVIFCMNGHQIK